MSAEILRLLVEAAERGEPCPSNRAMAEAVGYSEPSAVTKALGRLVCAGDIRVDRYDGRRCITITRTGRAILSAGQTREGGKHQSRRAAHSGMTPHEAQIMAHWDAGRPMRAIAAALGLKPRRIEATVSCYDGKADFAEFRRETKNGSAQLLAAIARHHPERIAA
jgi:DNA-binding CsgD family transcriptional regulator